MSGKPAARVTDPTTCPLPGHGSNPIVQGSPDVVFDGLPAARQGDASACGSPMISAVSSSTARRRLSLRKPDDLSRFV
ncbi:PAAR domain-containing protein, partial [Pseudomonas aeruginosa]|uniref:PAAR domain-containing protein n=1 Tax=Pseudomonas aeruginosa TaxID=287 RepID=UPI0014044723